MATDRREFLRTAGAAAAGLASGMAGRPSAAEPGGEAPAVSRDGLSDAAIQAVLDGQARRRDDMLRRQVEKPFPATGVWRVTDFALAALYLDQRVAEANEALAALPTTHPVDPEPARQPGGPEPEDYHWYINLLQRIWFLFAHDSARFPGRLSAEAEAALLTTFWQSAQRHCRAESASPDRLWWVWGSENHAAMRDSGFWGTAHILARQPAYRDQRYADGTAPADMANAWDRYYLAWARERAAKGLLVELGSDYGKYTLQGWYNQADFAPDPELRRRMGRLLDLYWADWAVEQIAGVRGGGRHRVYPGANSIRGALSGGNGMSWYHFGLGTPGSQHPAHLCAATTDYRPDPCVVDLALDVAGRGSYAYVSRRPGLNLQPKPAAADWQTYALRSDNGGILRYSWCTPEFVMGTSMVEARPDSDWAQISSQNRWDGVVFAGHPDAMILAQPRRPPKGSRYNAHWSIQRRGTMVLQKLSAKGAGQRVWFGGPLRRAERDGWVFAEAPAAFAAVRVVAGPTAWEPDTLDDHHEGKGPAGTGMWLALTNPDSPIVLEVAPQQDWASFAAFQEAVLANPLRFADGVLHYRGLGASGEFTFYADRSAPPLVDGQPLDRTPPKVYDCPFIQGAWGSGVVVLQKGRRRTVLDFTTGG